MPEKFPPAKIRDGAVVVLLLVVYEGSTSSLGRLIEECHFGICLIYCAKENLTPQQQPEY